MRKERIWKWVTRQWDKGFLLGVLDAMKAKKLHAAMGQLAEEGVVQVFNPFDGSPPIIGVIGALQLDVLVERMAIEYNLPIRFEPSRFVVGRWVGADDRAELERFTTRHHAAMARDADGAPVFLAESAFMLTYDTEKGPKITFSDIKDYQLQAPR